MRPRAGTTLVLSTVAKTAFSSAIDCRATTSVSAAVAGVPDEPIAAKAASRPKYLIIHRMELIRVMIKSITTPLRSSFHPHRNGAC